CQRRLLDAKRQMRAVLRAAGGDGIGSRPHVYAAVRVSVVRAGARGAISVDAHLIARASVPQYDVRERGFASSIGARARVRVASARCGAAWRFTWRAGGGA